jgi:hypothetical protein
MLTDEQKNEIIEQHRRVCGVTNRAIGSQNDIRFLAWLSPVKPANSQT